MNTHGRSHFPTDPVTWWRMSHERDLDSFARSHGRKPESLHELSKWLKPAPVRTERPRN
jgi:hypothetical protein